jgi:hypothetical protein
MKIEPGVHCPLLDKECIQFKCAFWTQLRGTHPQTGAEVDEYGCAIAWLPLLLIENAKEVRQGAAATESFRNEAVKAVGSLVAARRAFVPAPKRAEKVSGPGTNDA